MRLYADVGSAICDRGHYSVYLGWISVTTIAAILSMALQDCQIQQIWQRICQSEPAKAQLVFKMRIAATIANITGYLYDTGWSGFGLAPQLWAVIMLVVASLVGLGMALTRRDANYLFVWAFAGIAVKQAAEPLMAKSAWAATILALLLAVYSLVRRRQTITA